MKNKVYEEYVELDKIHKEHLLIGLIDRFDNRYQALADSKIPELSWKQVFFLKGVSIFKYPPNIRDMANYLGCSHQNATKFLKKLVSMGYVETKNDKVDGRMIRIYLTDRAKTYLQENEQPSLQMMKSIFSCMTEEEMKTVIDAMTKLDTRLNDIEKAFKEQKFMERFERR